ncbi:hypothetical protein J3D43_004996 [Paenibacillus xylanexedens]|nr:hypothetical protein [Paenibacillus xylanexedens]
MMDPTGISTNTSFCFVFLFSMQSDIVQRNWDVDFIKLLVHPSFKFSIGNRRIITGIINISDG